MKIGIIGNYGASNIGDDAVLTAILKATQGHKVRVFSAHPEMTKVLFGVKTAPLFPLGLRSCLKHGFRQSIKALKKTDAVILGGGGLFQDDRLYACFLWTWQIFWVRIFKKPLFIYATGVGPLNTWLGRQLTKWAYNTAEIITVRDHYSANLLTKIGVRPEIHITADPVFNYKKPDFAKGRTKNLFIISLRPWLALNQKIIHTFTSFLKDLKEEKKAEFIFVSMQQIKEHDMQMIEPLVRELSGEIYLPKHFSDLLQVMERAEFAIGMRYHFMIAAILTQTPIIPITYGPKTEELFAGSPLEGYMNKVTHLSEDKLRGELKKLSAGYNNAIVYEKSLAKQFSDLAQKNLELLLEFLKRFDQPKKDMLDFRSNPK